jgi:hypothetical protein
LHAEWAIKALRTGKHVLLEKPFASNAAEVREVKAEAEKAGKVVVEAFHWRFHPAAHWIRQKIDEGGWGDVQEVKAKLKIFGGAMGAGDSKWLYLQSMNPSFSQLTQSPASPLLLPSRRRSLYGPRLRLQLLLLFRWKSRYGFVVRHGRLRHSTTPRS